MWVNDNTYVRSREKEMAKSLSIHIKHIDDFQSCHNSILPLIISKEVVISYLGLFSCIRIALNIKEGKFMEGLTFIIKPLVMWTMTVMRVRVQGVDGMRPK